MGPNDVCLGRRSDGRFLVALRVQSVSARRQNNIRWCNKTAQVALDDLPRNYDPAGRRADIRIMQRQFLNDAPSIVSYMRVDLFAYNRDLKNYHPNNLTPFDNMMDVDI